MGIKEDMKEIEEMKKNWVEGKCNCGLAKSLTGDGCRYCQPQEYIDRLHEMIEEDDELKLQAIIAKKEEKLSFLALHIGIIHGTCAKVYKELREDA